MALRKVGKILKLRSYRFVRPDGCPSQEALRHPDVRHGRRPNDGRRLRYCLVLVWTGHDHCVSCLSRWVLYRANVVDMSCQSNHWLKTLPVDARKSLVPDGPILTTQQRKLIKVRSNYSPHTRVLVTPFHQLMVLLCISPLEHCLLFLCYVMFYPNPFHVWGSERSLFLFLMLH